jgi:translation initiation factor 3 subunit C
MSFFAKLGSGSDTDSDSGSESEESILSGDEGLEQDRKLAATAKKGKPNASMFLKSDDDSDEESSDEDESEDEDETDSDDEEGGRAVRSSGSPCCIHLLGPF